jgi:thiol:disulfide interchange protein DsbD
MSGYRASSLRLLAIALLAALCLARVAQAKDDFLPPEQAYKYATRVQDDRLIVTWKIEKGYYLYKNKLGIASASSIVRLNTPAWPKGELHKDEFFGEQEIYRGTVEIPVAMSFEGTRPAELPIELKLQGCADAGLCYPPLTWKSNVAIPAGAAAKTGLRSLFTSKAPSSNEEFLPPDEAFKFGAAMERPDSVALTWIIADGYYLYKDRIEVSTDSQNVQIGQPLLPKGEPKFDEYFGNTEVYYQFAEASVPVARAAGSTGKLNLKVTYQGCAEGGLCYNPITK